MPHGPHLGPDGELEWGNLVIHGKGANRQSQVSVVARDAPFGPA